MKTRFSLSRIIENAFPILRIEVEVEAWRGVAWREREKHRYEFGNLKKISFAPRFNPSDFMLRAFFCARFCAR